MHGAASQLWLQRQPLQQQPPSSNECTGTCKHPIIRRFCFQPKWHRAISRTPQGERNEFEDALVDFRHDLCRRSISSTVLKCAAAVEGNGLGRRSKPAGDSRLPTWRRGTWGRCSTRSWTPCALAPKRTRDVQYAPNTPCKNTTATTTSTPGHPLGMTYPLFISSLGPHPASQSTRQTGGPLYRCPISRIGIRVGVEPPVLSYARRLHCS